VSAITVNIAAGQEIVAMHDADGRIVVKVVDQTLANPLVSVQTVDPETAITPVATSLPQPVVEAVVNPSTPPQGG